MRWTAANETPRIATAEGGVIAESGAVYDASGAGVGRLASLPVQSWRGVDYVAQGMISAINMPPVFPAGASYWPQANGNPSESATAIAQCACYVQSAEASYASSSAVVSGTRPIATLAGGVFPADATLKTYLILQGDPGINRGPGRNYNVKGLFQLAADTERDAILARGDLAGTPKRVSSVQDFAAQLAGNGPITGGVVYFGHGTAVRYDDGTRGSALAPGEQAGVNTNITEANVGLLSNAQLAPSAVITLHACYAGFGSRRYSIAQHIANQLQRIVKAPTAGSFFSRDPNSTATGGTAPPLPSPLPKPVYLLQDGGVPFATFTPYLR